MHAAMRAGVLTAASADRSSAGTRGVLRDARGGASSGSTRVTPRTLAPRPVAVRRVVSATRDRATAPGLGAASEVKRRVTIECLHNATAGSEDKKLVAMWERVTHKDAHTLL